MSEFNKYPLIHEALLKDDLRDEIKDLQNEVNTLSQVIKHREKENAELKAALLATCYHKNGSLCMCSRHEHAGLYAVCDLKSCPYLEQSK